MIHKYGFMLILFHQWIKINKNKNRNLYELIILKQKGAITSLKQIDENYYQFCQDYVKIWCKCFSLLNLDANIQLFLFLYLAKEIFEHSVVRLDDYLFSHETVI